MKNPLEASNASLAQWLWNRRSTICTMCGQIMLEGYCGDINCRTYPKGLGHLLIPKFITAIVSTHLEFVRKHSLEATHSKVVSGGRIESKRRKH